MRQICVDAYRTVRVHLSTIEDEIEIHLRLTELCKLESRKATIVVESLTDQMKRLPKKVLTSLKRDRGREMCAHKAFTMATDMAVSLCDPSSPWKR